MGRHGGGPTRRTRPSWPVVAIGVLVIAAIGFGFWLWSVRSVNDPIDANPVDAYAVVVSSPSCTAGTGGTVIELNLTPAVRSSLSACGRRVGERIAVQYLAGHPDQARLAGTAVAHNNSARRWLPIAILAAGLLAVVGTLSLLIDRRRSRHDVASTSAVHRPTVAELRAAAQHPAAVHRPTVADPGAADQRSAAAEAGPDSGAIAGAKVATDVGETSPASHSGVEPDDAVGDEQGNPDTTTRIATHAFPGAGSLPLRSSDIAVDDDLFTHRTHHPG